MGRKFEDILDEVRDLDPEIAAELEAFKASSLRTKASERDEFERRALEAEEKVKKLEGASARDKAFGEYGIDFENLRPLERTALESYDGELTPEAIGEFVEKNQLPLTESSSTTEESESEEESGARQIARTAQRAGANGSRVPKVTPEDVASWPADKWVRFADANPDAAEALRRGEEVTGVTA